MPALICFLSLSGAQTRLRDGAWTLLNMEDSRMSGVAAGEGIVLASGQGFHHVIRSLDSGKTWSPFPPAPAPTRAPEVGYDPAARLFYCKTDSAIFAAAPTALAWKRIALFSYLGGFATDGPTLAAFDTALNISRDGGKTWRRSRPPTSFGISRILAADSCVYVSDGNDPIQVSCDGGASWAASGGAIATRGAAGMARYQNSVIAIAEGSLIRTLNRGKTWSAWTGGLATGGEVYRLAEANGLLYAWKYSSAPTDVKIYRSPDGGQSWIPLTPPSAASGSSPSLDQITNLGATLIGANSGGVAASTDTGRTWKHIPMGTIAGKINSLAVWKNRYLAHTDRGLFASSDTGITWRSALEDDSAATWDVFGGTAPLLAVANRKGQIRVTQDAGGTWSASETPAGKEQILSIAVREGRLYVGTTRSLYHRSDTGGAWTEFPLPSFASPRLLAAGRHSMLIGTDRHIWEFRGGDSLWNRDAGVDDRMFAGNIPAATLYQWSEADAAWREIRPAFPSYSIAGSGDRLMTPSRMVSEDGGKTWANSYPPPYPTYPLANFSCLTFSGGHFYGGDEEGGVWRHEPYFPEPTVPIAPFRRFPGRAGTADARRSLEEGRLRIDGRRTLRIKPGPRSRPGSTRPEPQQGRER
jgi:photosystem II stability/assembly factor-like uncharacterized protein